MPGLIVDRYNDLLSVQIVTQAMDAEAVRGVVVSELREALNPAAIVERVDPRVRRLEQLAEKESGAIFGEKTATEFQMNGVRFVYEALGGQKTGAFLDQRENYAAAARYAQGRGAGRFLLSGRVWAASGGEVREGDGGGQFASGAGDGGAECFAELAGD